LEAKSGSKSLHFANRIGLQAYEKAGFKEFGRRRECRVMGGRLYDEVYMDCLASEFDSAVLGRIFAPEDAPGIR
jgi:diamine N-acetyltransferase